MFNSCGNFEKIFGKVQFVPHLMLRDLNYSVHLCASSLLR